MAQAHVVITQPDLVIAYGGKMRERRGTNIDHHYDQVRYDRARLVSFYVGERSP